MKYITKPIVVEAFQFGHVDEFPGWFVGQEIGFKGDGLFFLPKTQGRLNFKNGDMIIKGTKGEIYPCKADIFNELYEKDTK